MSATRGGSTRLAWVVALVLLADHAGAAAAVPQPTEAEVKAAFLYHFAQFVTWPEPEARGGEEARPIVIAVLGPNPFGSRLEEMVAGETVRGRPLVVRRAAKLGDLADDPHILFIGFGDRADVDRALDSVQASPVLTVGDASGFAERGGMIGFRLTADSRVAFDINLKAVQAAGLKMSSQLLKIARVVESEP